MSVNPVWAGSKTQALSSAIVAPLLHDSTRKSKGVSFMGLYFRLVSLLAHTLAIPGEKWYVELREWVGIERIFSLMFQKQLGHKHL